MLAGINRPCTRRDLKLKLSVYIIDKKMERFIFLYVYHVDTNEFPWPKKAFIKRPI